MQSQENFSNCIICGESLKYSQESELRECSICAGTFLSNAECVRGHFVCDSCHSYGALASVMAEIRRSSEKNPIRLLEAVMKNPKVHMHGPEHHVIVPLVLLTAYRNCGGKMDYDSAVKEAYKRAKQVPGGTCGYWGVCGAAAGAGIYASIIIGSNPMNGKAWHKPMEMTSACLKRIASCGGPRCCKRTSRLAVEEAAAFTFNLTGIRMPVSAVKCAYAGRNRECIADSCPYYGAKARGEKLKWNLSLKIKD